MLCDLVRESARKGYDAIAVCSTDGTDPQATTYGALDTWANRFAHALTQLGVRQGDRVGIWLDKSVASVIVMQAVLRLRAIYVPLDPLSTIARICTIVYDCDMRVLVTIERRAGILAAADLEQVTCLYIDGQQPGAWPNLQTFPATFEPVPALANDRAYILYRSGLTEKSRGICISNRNALAFIEWATQELEVTATDRLANHAPLHSGLAVCDLYVAFRAGAATYLIPDEISCVPQRLVSLLMQEALTIWYSVPSVLILMIECAGLLERATPALRAILFTGELFPIKYLRQLYQRYGSTVRIFSLYGPTETNICAYYEMRERPEYWHTPVPIGKACCGNNIWAEDAHGKLIEPSEEGELIVAGPTAMVSYWGQPCCGERPYATGDLVRLLADSNYLYVGRRDRQPKIRRNRIALSEIELVLEQHPAIREAAVIVTSAGLEARLVACIVYTNGAILSLVSIRKLCSEHLPCYMIIDDIYPLAELPRTRSGKIDHLALERLHDEHRG